MKTYVGMGPVPLVSAVPAGPVPASSIQIPARWRTGRRPGAQFLAAAVSILVDRTLTEAGAAAHAELLRKVSRSRQRLSAGISPQEDATTIDVLRRMAVNLGWADSS